MDDWKIRACAWPPRALREDKVRLITAEELRGWIVEENEEVIVVNKPGDVVCHPSKAGPWSSLVGAVREFTGLPVVHLIFRLDRETSGVVVLAKSAAVASRLQKAMERRQVDKRYLAILAGELREAVRVDQPLGTDTASPVYIKDTVRVDGKAAVSHFEPVAWGGGFTLARVKIETGRKHQIRAHAQWLGHPVVGDKIYGPDDRCYLDFIDTGYTPELAAKLLLPRQALHCAEITFAPTWEGGTALRFRAPLPGDLREFVEARMGAGVVEAAEAGLYSGSS